MREDGNMGDPLLFSLMALVLLVFYVLMNTTGFGGK